MFLWTQTQVFSSKPCVVFLLIYDHELLWVGQSREIRGCNSTPFKGYKRNLTLVWESHKGRWPSLCRRFLQDPDRVWSRHPPHVVGRAGLSGRRDATCLTDAEHDGKCSFPRWRLVFIFVCCTFILSLPRSSIWFHSTIKQVFGVKHNFFCPIYCSACKAVFKVQVCLTEVEMVMGTCNWASCCGFSHMTLKLFYYTVTDLTSFFFLLWST